MGVGSPEVSVVIATRNRARRLAAMLASLHAQTLGTERFEVIVVNDGSTDDTPAVLAEELRRSKLDLRLVQHEPGGGPGAARNAGWPLARAPLIAFTDDDCEADPAWLQQLLVAWGGEPEQFLQGATTPIAAELGNQGLLTYTYDIRELNLNFATCNMAYPKVLLERLGGFDAAAFPYTGEDCDLAWRAIEAGAEVRFAAEARAYHAVVKMDHVGFLRRHWSWGHAVTAFARHPELRRRRLIHRVFFNWSHWYLLRAVVALALPRRRALWPLKFWLSHRYVRSRWRAPGEALPSPKTLAWHVAVDVVEITAMVGGSIRNGTVVL